MVGGVVDTSDISKKRGARMDEWTWAFRGVGAGGWTRTDAIKEVGGMVEWLHDGGFPGRGNLLKRLGGEHDCQG